MTRVLCLLWFVCATVACATVGRITDGTSVAYGHTSDGELINGARLPNRGDGYMIPPTWDRRGLAWGTDELVRVIVHSAREVAREAPGGELYVGDLSSRRGGHSSWHHSHQNGRDVDILFYATRHHSTRAAPPPDQMVRYDADGRAVGVDNGPDFDTARNWLLVKALLQNPISEVQFIFIAEHLKVRLLVYALETNEPTELLLKAHEVMRQPTDSLAHDDHMHVRIYCPPSDLTLGCTEYGPLRWLKKGYKYAAEGPALRRESSVPAFLQDSGDRVGLFGYVMSRLFTHQLLAMR